MSNRELRIGVLGAGIISGIHLPNLQQIAGVRVAAVCDTDELRANTAAATYGAQPYAEAQGMLDTADLDALFVCLPPFARGDIVEQAARRGLHLYVEKPLALDLPTALRTLGVIEEAGVIASAGYMWRYAPVVDLAQAALAGDAPALLLGRMLNGPPGPAWAFDRGLSGGLLVEFATHMADLLRYLGGEITHVGGGGAEVTPGPPTRGPDSAVLALRYASDAAGSLATSWAFGGALWDVQALTRDAQLYLNLNPEQLHGHIRGAPVDQGSAAPEGIHPHGFNGGPSWYLAAQAFVDAIRTGDPGLVRSPYRDGVRTLALTLAADEAIRTGRTVAVERI